MLLERCGNRSRRRLNLAFFLNMINFFPGMAPQGIRSRNSRQPITFPVVASRVGFSAGAGRATDSTYELHHEVSS